MTNLLVTGWLCLRCCRRLIDPEPGQHCPCSQDPVRVRIRVLDRGLAA